MSNRIAPYERVAWMEFRNVSSEEVPPFGVVHITGTVTAGPGRLLLEGDKPDAYGSQWSHYINGRLPVPAGQDGLCAVPCGPVIARLAPDTTVEPGTPCGPLPDSWHLHPKIGGFQLLGNAEGGRVLVTRMPLLRVRGILVEPLNSGGEAGLHVTDWSGTEWIESDRLLSVKEILGVEDQIPEGTVCVAEWFGAVGFAVTSTACDEA